MVAEEDGLRPPIRSTVLRNPPSNKQRGLRRSERGPSTHAWWMWGGRIAAGILPLDRFLQGQTFFVRRLHELRGVPPVHVHVTYNMGLAHGKRWRLRQALDRHAKAASFGSGRAVARARTGVHDEMRRFKHARMNYQSLDVQVFNLKTLHGQVKGMQAQLHQLTEAVDAIRSK